MPILSFSHIPFKSKIILGTVLPLILLCLVSTFVYFSIQRQNETNTWVEHTHKVISEGQQLLKLLIDMETGQRGFLITGEVVFLEPFYSAKTIWDNKLTSLKALVSDNVEQVKRLNKIGKLQKRWLTDAAEPEIAARRMTGKTIEETLNSVRKLVERGTGKGIIDKVRVIKDQFIELEEVLMEQRLASQKEAVELTVLIVISGTILATALASIFVWYLSGNIINTLNILIRAVEKTEQGNFDNIIKINSNDEFHLLARSFNQMNNTLKESIQKMENAIKAKGDFLANMSHEIRTPMNGILGMLTLLEETKLDDEQNEYIESIRTCGDGLLVVINDILDISKLEAGKLHLESMPFDLRRTINECCYLLDVQASNKGLNIRADIDDKIPDFLIGDKLRIRQILLNIINNAIKFTEKGTVDLKVILKSQLEDQSLIYFSVEDKGIGISKEDQTKLFKAFSQVDNSISRKYGGTGLGLIICAQLVKQMKGDIFVESELNKGTTFTFNLPLLRAKDNLSSSSNNCINQLMPQEKLSKKYPVKILLAEDNNINQAIAKKLFQKLGYSIDMAKDGLEAVESVLENKYDMVFMDMQMPNMDGVTATKEIIKLQPDEHPYIVAMTANVLLQDKQRCFDAGMQGFVGKPVNIDHIIKAIEQYGNRTTI